MADPLLAFIFSFSREELKQKGIDDEYTRLLETCRGGGLAVVGKRCRIPGTILIFVDCHDNEKKNAIVHWDNSHSFPTNASATVEPSRAAVLRALYAYLTLPPSRGGLDLSPGSHNYPHLKLLLSPHPPLFRNAWIKKLIGDLSFGYSERDIAHMGALYGEQTAIYFSFLTHYARALVLPAAIGIVLHFGAPALSQHPLSSVFLISWAIVFTQQWHQKYRRLSASFSTKVSPIGRTISGPERRSGRWVTAAKSTLTIPLLLVGMSFVCFNMTVAFLLEAFIARLYDGPLHYLAPLVPTVYNVITTPPFVGVYSAISDKMTSWESHATQHAHDFSLLIKLLPINGIVAFYALILSAGIYIPFGDELMAFFHLSLFEQSPPEQSGSPSGTWRRAVLQPPATTPKTRLAEQMFAFTLVLQLFPIALETLVPFVVRFATTRLTNGGRADASKPGQSTQGSEKARLASKEDELIDRVTLESSLPSHRFFDDYLTLTIQFGYGVLWSTTWALTPAVLLLLAVIRLRTDALKMLVHYRSPIPSVGGCEAAGIWTGALSFVSWAGALINALLVFVIHPLVRGVPDGPRAHRIDVPAFVYQVKNSNLTLLASVGAIRSHLGSLATHAVAAEDAAISRVKVTAAVLLISSAYVAAQYFGHHLASARDQPVLDGTVEVVSKAFDHLPSAPAAPSLAFWVEDEGESEIRKKTS